MSIDDPEYQRRYALFEEEVKRNATRQAEDASFAALSKRWIEASAARSYSYNFSWLGRPLIQYPQDVLALQEIIWSTRPQLIIETGVAHGGSLIFYASMMELIGGSGQVLGIDVDIRPHNRAAIEAHPLFHRISLLQASSVDPDAVEHAAALAKDRQTMVVLDSNHTHDHVLTELRCYSALVTKGCYLVVLDTIIEDLPEGQFADRPWSRGNNPKTAVHEFLRTTDRFEIDRKYPEKLMITVAPDGFLHCTKDR